MKEVKTSCIWAKNCCRKKGNANILVKMSL
jgi:hypothetical protein